MELVRPERPKIEFTKVHKSFLPLISTVITVLAFVLSNQRLTVQSALVAVAIIVGLAYLIHLISYGIRYVKYLRETERNHDRLMQLYGEKESEVVERDRIISSYPKQLIENFRWGAIKGRASKSNELLADLSKKEISILEKASGNNGIELIFDVGAKDGIKERMLLSIVTAYGNDLWGVVKIIRVSDKKCTGEVISKINMNFWSHVEKEMYYDASPPPHIKARLYSGEDLVTELRLMESKLKQKG